jgi:hypothetical protein
MNASGISKFREIIGHYRRLLLANPGKGLLICEGGNAAILDDGEVYGAAILLDGTPELDNLYEFDLCAFNTDLGCWDGETPAQTWARINNPTFIDLVAPEKPLSGRVNIKFWEDVSGAGKTDYCSWKLIYQLQGLDALKALFPAAEADDMNFVLFSTAGVHGSYQTLEQEQESPGTGVTFLVIQPRLVLTRYGVVYPKSVDDFAFLKKLRATSLKAMTDVGADT